MVKDTVSNVKSDNSGSALQHQSYLFHRSSQHTVIGQGNIHHLSKRAILDSVMRIAIAKLLEQCFVDDFGIVASHSSVKVWLRTLDRARKEGEL